MAYAKEFTPSPDNGKEFNVWGKNNHSSMTVKLKATHVDSDTDFGYKSIGPRDEIVRRFYMPDGSGLSGKWKVYLKTPATCALLRGGSLL
ncbi:hypothetical protein [Brevibacillus massiliensis]|uniref:hypothetical protein n=1 Tax=Brevibacillus massiliensis TaxID=1118054 RepID=UPI0003828537|nr:hypothetical protein [Brevibacillus massiliensis]